MEDFLKKKRETLERRVKGDFSIKHNDISELKKMFDFLNISYMDAPEEADSQCAYLARQSNVLGVYSRDTDMFMYGASRLITDIDFKKKTYTYVSKKRMLHAFDISYTMFVDLCILLGCDYCLSMPGIGYKSAFKLIKTKSLEEIIKTNLKNVTDQKNYYTRVKFTRKYVFEPIVIKFKLKPYTRKNPVKETAEFLHLNYGFKSNLL